MFPVQLLSDVCPGDSGDCPLPTLSPGLGLAQPWLLEAFGERTSRWNVCVGAGGEVGLLLGYSCC